MTSDPIKLWESAANAFEQRHKLIQDQHLSLPTPCPEFDIAGLVEHAVGTQIGIGQLLGSTAQEGDTWEQARSAMSVALAAPNSLEGTIEHPAMGETPLTRMLGIATNDLLIHSWDLARALEVDDTLPEQNLQAAIDGIEAFPAPLREMLFASPLDTSESATTQARLLAVAGRQA